MEKTDNYQLPQWSKNDFIKMDDFNEAFSTLDGALKAQADAVAGKAGGEEITAVRQEISETRAANCLVKLAGPLVTTAANAAMEFDLSQVDMTQVAALFVVYAAGASSGSMSLLVNDTAVATAGSYNFSTGGGFAWLVPMESGALCFSMNATNKSNSYGNSCGAYTGTSWENITRLTLSGASKAGATATLFAVRK